MEKKYKSNFMTTAIFFFIGMYVCFSPIFIVTIIGGILSKEILASLTGFILLIIIEVFTFVFFNLICIIINIFRKPCIIKYNEYFIYKGKEIKYEDIKYIEYDIGELKRNEVSVACSLYLYDVNKKLIVKIKHPSYLFTLSLFKKCKYTIKRIIGLSFFKMPFIIFIVTGFVLGIILLIVL